MVKSEFLLRTMTEEEINAVSPRIRWLFKRPPKTFGWIALVIFISLVAARILAFLF